MTTDGSISTDCVEPRRRFAFWQDLVCDVFVPIQCRSPNTRDFRARMQQSNLDCLTVVEAWSDPIQATRTRRHAARCADNEIIVAMPLAGPIIIEQRGRRADILPGQFVLYESAQQHVLSLPGASHMICLKLPRDALVQRLGGRLDTALTRKVDAERGLPALFSALARTLPQARGATGPLDATAATYATDLLALAIAGDDLTALQVASSRALSRSRLERVIALHSADADLSPERAAGLAGMSVRHANRLLADAGTSLERAILEQRLQNAHALLSATGAEGLPVSQIAFRCGFSDCSHFARAFKRRFGLSPRDARAIAARGRAKP